MTRPLAQASANEITPPPPTANTTQQVLCIQQKRQQAACGNPCTKICISTTCAACIHVYARTKYVPGPVGVMEAEGGDRRTSEGAGRALLACHLMLPHGRPAPARLAHRRRCSSSGTSRGRSETSTPAVRSAHTMISCIPAHGRVT